MDEPEVTPAAAYAAALRETVDRYLATGGTQKKMATALHVSPGTLSRYLSGQRVAARATLHDMRAFLQEQEPPLEDIDWAKLETLCERAHAASGSPAVQLAQLKEELARVREEIAAVREEQEQDHHVADERLAELEEQALDLADQLRQALARAHTAEEERDRLQDRVTEQDESLRHARGTEAELTRQQEQALARAHAAEGERDRLQDRVGEQDESLRHARDYVHRMEAELTRQQDQASGLLRELAVLRVQNRRLLEDQQAVSTPETQPAPGVAAQYAHLTDHPHAERTETPQETRTPPQRHPDRNPLPGQRTPTPGDGTSPPSRSARLSRAEVQARLRAPTTAWVVVAVASVALCAYTAATVVLAVPAVGEDMTSTPGPAASMVTCNLLAAAFAGWSGRLGVQRYGPRVILPAGLLLLAVGSLVASWSQAYDMWAPRPAVDRSIDWAAVQLLTGCALQGLGEGLCAAVARAVLAAPYWYPGPGRKTTRAVAAGTAIAVTASGLILSTWAWRIAFQVPAVIALAMLLTLPFLYSFKPMPLLDDLYGPDFRVLALVAGAHTTLVCAIALTPTGGWWSPSAVALTALAVTMLVKASRRLHMHAIGRLPNWLRGAPLFWAWVSGAVQYTAWLYCSLVLQQLFGHEAWTAAGLLLLAVPLTALTVLPGSAPTRLRSPARIVGFLATAAGLLWLATGPSHPDTFPALSLVGALALVGVGTATLRCPPNGLKEEARRSFDAHTKYSGALAVALTTSLITAHAHTETDGYDTVLIVCAEVAVVAALVGAARARRPKKPPEPTLP
ncbi:MFS transporter [Streptomyces sp. SID1046]|uniref:MFS transporter n=1 Tax=Streptomyces sp. SID1046 TaxID=2690249 RepID=UPI001369D864|nr:MFS transporter [Streptomyces sp. SID1046]MYV76197.1 MFS transporter [Streptomyces sp. SID1046]